MTHYSNTNNPVDFPKTRPAERVEVRRLSEQQPIDRLWGEALDKAVPETYTTLSTTQIERARRVYAQLIIEECINVTGADMTAGAIAATALIINHFDLDLP